ncbi:MAG: SprB repeat-containing protein, partial [Phaeodactylibacter sp.]|nr:SprB repeat-containing protein [Phaeodactylibacter sp.]
MEMADPSPIPDAARYQDALMMVDIVELFLKAEYEDDEAYKLIEGKDHNSSIDEAGIDESSPDNSNAYPNHILTQQGSWNTQGIIPYAYSDDEFELSRDDFYFTDFITRIHKDDPMDGGQAQIANCPEDARYNDGRYELKARATDVRGNDDFEETASFTLDNFQPYIAGLSFYSNDQILYTRNWSCDGGCGGITLGQSPITGVDPSDWSSWISNPDAWLEVSSSEPLEELTLDIIIEVGSLSQILAEEIEGTPNTASDEWNFDLSEYFEKFQGKIIFRFNGKDFSGNSLLDLSSNQQSCLQVPVRDSETSWYNPDGLATGSDQVHAICISCEENPAISDDCGIINIVSPTGFCLNVDINIRDASGSNVPNGQIDLTVTGGVPPYQYQWADGNTQPAREDLNPGEYCLTITDALCCTYEECPIVEVCTKELSIVGEVEHMCANGSPTGSIDVTISGGGGLPSYLWNTGATTQDLTNIEVPGIYNVSVTDACENSEVKFFDVGIFFTSPLDYYINNPSSCNSDDGDIYVTAQDNPMGGTPPYTFQWSTGQETPNIGGLGAGAYILTITDAEGCAQAFTFNLVPEGSPQIELSDIITPSCEGEDNGAIEILTYTEDIHDYSHLYPAYEILWYNSSGQLIYTDPNNNYDSDATGLPPGAYTVTVKDISGSPFSGCSSSATFIVEELPSLGPFVAIPQITPTCYGDNTGRIVLNTSGGNPPYTYSWDNGQYTQSINYLSSPSSYSVTVTDNCGRKIIHNGLSVPSYTAISNTIVSEGGCPGSIELETSGGGAPYTYLWSNGQTGVTATGLINGSGYQVTVSDANGCTMAQTFFVPIDEEDAFDLLISDVTAPSVPGSTNGFISVSSEPAGSYSYLWSNGSTGASVGGLGPGNYSVTATNAAGCSVARAINLQSCYTFPGSAPNFTDFEIMATGGMFSSLTDQEATLSALIKDEGETFFTENIPEHYSIRWEFPNGILIGNGGNLIVDQATVLANRPNFLEKGWASISLIVSNGCIEKKLNHYFIICGQVEEQFANTVLSGFFFLESAIIHPCSGLSDGSITVEIPNPEGSEISVIRD